MENLTATFLLRDAKVPTSTNIERFRLEPVPGYPNHTYLRFNFTHTPKKDPYYESHKQIQLFSLVLSVLYKVKYPEFKTTVGRLGPITEAAGPSVRIPTELKQKDFDKIEKAYKEVKSMTGEDREIFDFIARWVQKASDSHNVYDKFSSYWIAFNFLYGRMRGRGERQKIEKWVNTQCNKTYASKFFAAFQESNCESPECKTIEDLANANLEVKRLNKPPIKASKKLSEKIRGSEFDLEALRYLALCIYGVRNSVFHGHWLYLDKTRGHVGAAKFLLYKLIMRGLQKQCNFTF